MRRTAVAAALAMIGGAASAAPVPVTGQWLTAEGKALVEIGSCGAALCGRVVRVLKRPAPGVPLDRNNRDPSLRGRPVEGLSILSGFTAAGEGWHGRIYDPESGRSYRSELVRHGDMLDVKGCLGPFCRTQHWTARRPAPPFRKDA